MKYTSSASSASSTLSSSSSVLPQIVAIEKFFGKWEIMMEIPKANFKWSSCEGGFQVGKKYFLDTFYSCQIYQPPQRELSFVASESPTPSSGWAPAMSGALKVVTISSFWKIHCFRKSHTVLRAWGLSPLCGRDTESNHKSSSHLSEQVGMLRWQYIGDQ